MTPAGPYAQWYSALPVWKKAVYPIVGGLAAGSVLGHYAPPWVMIVLLVLALVWAVWSLFTLRRDMREADMELAELRRQLEEEGSPGDGPPYL